MRFASLGSGSRGNALVVECGFGARDAVQRLARLGLEAADLAAIVVTHEHSDHIAGAYKFARRAGIRVFLTHGTLNGFAGDLGERPNLVTIDSHQSFGVGDIEIQPYPVPHDAREPVQYVFSDGAARVGVLTDTGESTTHI